MYNLKILSNESIVLLYFYSDIVVCSFNNCNYYVL